MRYRRPGDLGNVVNLAAVIADKIERGFLLPTMVSPRWLERAYAYRVGEGLRANDKANKSSGGSKNYGDQLSIIKQAQKNLRKNRGR